MITMYIPVCHDMMRQANSWVMQHKVQYSDGHKSCTFFFFCVAPLGERGQFRNWSESTSSKIGLPPPGGPQKNCEKMCKTYALHCISYITQAQGLGRPRALPPGLVQPCPKPRALIHKHVVEMVMVSVDGSSRLCPSDLFTGIVCL